jgi:hypothetical protein
VVGADRSRLGFRVSDADIRNDILIPEYYDPEIDDALSRLEPTHELVSIGALIDGGLLELRQGKYVSKLLYGTGVIPYVRTSDISNSEIRASPKHGVSDAVWEDLHAKQDVRPGDVLLVHEGTYLIGVCALVTSYDLPMLFQHHLAKLRVADEAPLTGPLLAALFGAPIVQRQIRSKQFTADIIDSIVGRLQEVVLPLPKDLSERARLADRSGALFTERAETRSRLSLLVKRVDEALVLGDGTSVDAVLRDELRGSDPMSLLGERVGFRAFQTSDHEIRNDVLVPAYYDPTIAEELSTLEAGGCELMSIRQLVERGALALETGDEVGKLAYGTGNVPFVRTSDLGTWELKLDPKQRVSRAIYDSLASKQSARAGDLLVVRDGTYLVGTAAMVSEEDIPLLFSGGVYRVRVEMPDLLDPNLLLVLLWSRVVRRQIRAKRFTRDVIDTLGRRFEEVILPIPTGDLRESITNVASGLMSRRVELRREVGELGELVERASRDRGTALQG